MAFVILISSLISARLGISVAIMEIIFGFIIGNVHIMSLEAWMLSIASFGGLLITFLSGLEIDVNLMKKKLKEIFLIGFLSFLITFLSIFLLTYIILDWNLISALLAGTALSETSIAIVYSNLTQKNLFNQELGKILMGATFVTNICTVTSLSILFIEFNIFSLIFYIVSFLTLVFAFKYSNTIFKSFILKSRLLEFDVKYIFVLIFFLMFLASIGKSQALLPIFLMGVLFSSNLKNNLSFKKTVSKLKIFSFSLFSPLFFFVGGMRISISLIIGTLGIFIFLFLIRQIAKFIGVYFITKHYFNENKFYMTFMMSTGLTFGLIATSFGLTNGILNQSIYSLLTGILLLSAIIPNLFAEKSFNLKLNRI